MADSFEQLWALEGESRTDRTIDAGPTDEQMLAIEAELRHKVLPCKLPPDVITILLQNARETDFIEMARQYGDEEAAGVEQWLLEADLRKRLEMERDELEAEGNYGKAAEVGQDLCHNLLRLVGEDHPGYQKHLRRLNEILQRMGNHS